jgi:hypothetical protein
MGKKKQITNILIILLTVEKTIQHFLLALSFMGLFSWIATPDIGPHIIVNNFTMAVLNLFYALLFIVGLFGMVKRMRWGIPLIISMAGLDIILEFIFHGLLYITVSVIVSTILIILLVFYTRMKPSKVSA